MPSCQSLRRATLNSSRFGNSVPLLTPRRLAPAQTHKRRLRWLLCERVRRGNLKPRKHFRFLWRVLSNLLEGKGDACLREAKGAGRGHATLLPSRLGSPGASGWCSGSAAQLRDSLFAAYAKHVGQCEAWSLDCRVSEQFLAEAGPQCLEARFLASSHSCNSGPRLSDLHACCGKSNAVSTMRSRETSLPSLTLLYLAIAC